MILPEAAVRLGLKPAGRLLMMPGPPTLPYPTIIASQPASHPIHPRTPAYGMGPTIISLLFSLNRLFGAYPTIIASQPAILSIPGREIPTRLF